MTTRGGAIELIKQMSKWDENVPLMLIGEPAPADWPEEIRRRVLTSLEMPPSYNKLLDSLHRAQIYREMYESKTRGRQREPNLFRSLVGTSRAVQHVRQMMEQVADTEASVLILGESGTGKEVVARNLHYHSKRRQGPFVPVNCGAIPAELLESELFGHEKAPLPARSPRGQGASNWPRAVRCSSTKSATCRYPCRSSFFVYCRSAHSSASAATARRMPMFGSLPRPTRIWKR